MKSATTTIIVSIVTLVSFSIPTGAVEDGQAIENGKSVSEQQCSRCHVVGDYNPNGGISSTPSFQLMVNALDDYEERFDTFYIRPPHPAVIVVEGIKKRDDLPFNAAPVKLTQKDVENIAAFVKTLKNK